MKTFNVFMLGFAVVTLVACDGREKGLELKNTQLLSEKDSLLFVMQSQERYFDDVVTSIGEVYSRLEDVRAGEKEIRMQTGEGEGSILLSNDQSRHQLLKQIEEIDHTLMESRATIVKLESRVASLNREFAGLNTIISNLKQQLEEREQQLAMLETRVTGLEGEVIAKNQQLVQRDSVIQSRDSELNTVYYIVGTRAELKEKGIITAEGGFFWGLLGSTSVLSSGVNDRYFKPFDKTRDRFIMVDGEIDEIIPRRNEEYYMSDQVDENQSNLEIVNPTKFWQDRYLVIVKG